MNGRTIIAILGLLVVLALGAWMAGLFDSAADSNDPVVTPTANAGEGPEVEIERPGISKVQTDRFKEDKPTMTPEGTGEPVASRGGGFRLVGRVIAQSGGPIEGAKVDLMEDNGAMAQVHQMGTLVESVDTEADGLFSFEGLVPGERMILRVTHPKFTMGRVLGIDAAVKSTLRQTVRLETGFAIRGVVTHTTLGAVEGVRVAAYDVNLQAYEPEDQLERDVLTGPDGTFEMNGLSKGIKRLVASKPGFASKTIPTFIVPSNTEQVKFTMTDGFSIDGMVLEAGTQTPVPGIRIIVRPLGNGRRAGGIPRVESVLADEEGRFSVFGLESGNCEIWARGTTHLASQRQVIPAGQTGIIIEVPPAARLVGKVVDGQSQEPVTDYTLIITGNADVVIASRAFRRRVSDPEGRFIFAGVQPMKLFLVVRAKGYAETLHGPITVAQGELVENIVVKLGRGSTVRGAVMDDLGKGIAGAKVTLSRTSNAAAGPAQIFLGPIMEGNAPTAEGVTDSSGNYTINGLRDGTWKIRARHDKYATDREMRVTVGRDDEQDAPPVTLQRAGGVRGIVRTKEGEPDNAARITVSSLHNQLLKFPASTRPDGTFELLGLPPGDYRIQVIQRAGIVDLGGLLAGVASGSAPSVYTVRPGQVIEVQL